MERLDRLERLTNLVLALLDARRPLTLSELAGSVGGYPGPGEARRRAFERDKRLLREEGIPVTTVALDGPEQYGYRVLPEEYYLPELVLSEEEQVALNMAVAGVHVGDHAGRQALLKLGILARDEPGPKASLPSLPGLAVLDRAARSRSTVRFAYRGQHGEAERREVEPYGLGAKGGWWSLVGRDTGRGALRRFRVDRIEGMPEVGEPGAFELPDDLDLAATLPAAPWRLGEGEAVTAEIAVDALATPQAIEELGTEALVERSANGSGRFAVEVTNPSAFRSWALGLLGHAEVLGPPELRADIVAWLAAVAEGAPEEAAAGPAQAT
ncbi:MAG: helix-turn-helix transcriptional regulator [Acidimicrobiales bacterium]